MGPIAAGGRAEGSVLLRPRGCPLISSHQSSVPGKSSASLSHGCSARLPPPSPRLCCLLNSPASISTGAVRILSSWNLLPSVSPHALVLVGASASLSHSWAVGCSCLCPGWPACLSVFPLGILSPSSNLPIQPHFLPAPVPLGLPTLPAFPCLEVV